jgi:RNA polymerase sigma-70 factor (ECF subfamily)
MERDEDIVKRIQAGNHEEFGELINRYENKLKRYGTRFLGRPESITDMVQDVFVKAFTHLQSFSPDERFSPWIYRIAHNTFINELRRQSRFQFGLFDLDTEALFPTLIANESADTLALTHENKTRIEEALKKLPPRDREIIVLAFYEELTYEEMSDILHISLSAVGVRLHRAKTKLATLLTTNHTTP